MMYPVIQRPVARGASGTIAGGTIRSRLCLAAILVGASVMPSGPAVAQERLLRCMTSTGPARPGHPSQHFAQRHFYAPARNAMFFSPAQATCRWGTARHRRS